MEDLEKIVKQYRSVKISWDKDDGFFIELLDAGRINESFTVAEDNLEDVHQSIFEAVESTKNYIENHNKDF